MADLPCARPGLARQALRAAGLAAVLLLLAPRPASAIVFQDSTAQAAGVGAGVSYLNGEAQLIISLSNSTAVICSASLIAGGQYLLTAAHCVTGDSNNLTATNISVTFANTGLTDVSASYVVDPTWTGNLTTGGDLAVIKLATPVTSIAGYALDTTSSATGDVVTMAGYGNTGYGATGYVNGSYGTLYYGQNTYDGLYAYYPSDYAFDFNKYGTSLYNVFGDSAVGTNEVMIAPGDSGGGSLINVGGTWELVGVHDFIGCVTNGCTANSSFGQVGGDTSVYADAAFILGATEIPEPGSLGLCATALAALAAARRRRAQRLTCSSSGIPASGGA